MSERLLFLVPARRWSAALAALWLALLITAPSRAESTHGVLESQRQTLAPLPEHTRAPAAMSTPLGALAVKARASSIWSSAYAAARAIDGDASSRWSAARDVRSGWLKLDLQRETRTDGVAVRSPGSRENQEWWSGTTFRGAIMRFPLRLHDVVDRRRYNDLRGDRHCPAPARPDLR